MKGKKALFCILTLLVTVAFAMAADNTQTSRLPVKSKTAVKLIPTSKDANQAENASEPKKIEGPEKPKPAEENLAPSGGNCNDQGHDNWQDHPREGGDRRGYQGRRDHRWGPGRHGSWDFWRIRGPIVFPFPVLFPHVIRLPRPRVGVYVVQTGSDRVGADFALSVRERLRSAGLRSVSSRDEASLELYIVSMDEDPEYPGEGSAVSVSYIWSPGSHFITAQMLDVGAEQVDAMAASVVDYADELIDDYR